MTEVLVFSDAVFHAVTFLRAQLGTVGDGATVADRVPDPRPARLVKVTRTGGARLDLIRDQPQLTVESWAAKQEQAHDLAQLCRGLLWVLPDRYTDATFYNPIEVGGVVDLPDPDTTSPRFTFTIQFDLRGDAL